MCESLAVAARRGNGLSHPQQRFAMGNQADCPPGHEPQRHPCWTVGVDCSKVATERRRLEPAWHAHPYAL